MTVTVLGTGVAVVASLMTLLWAVSVYRKDVSIVDWFWGPAFALFAWSLMLRTDSLTSRAWVLSTLLTIWALRLAVHLYLRSRGKGEDPRYAAMRQRDGAKFWWFSLFKVFLFQGALVCVISAPVIYVIGSSAAAWTTLDTIATVVFAVGFLFEAVGDHQLTQFRSNPSSRGRVLDHGLWRYTRHPNYFGDALLWWGVGLFAIASPGGWWTFFGPLLMTALLLKVSGVALLEQSLVESRPKYRDYIERTSAFIPWFPRKERS